MKKLLVLAIASTLAACGSSDSDNNSSDQGPKDSDQTNQFTPATDTVESLALVDASGAPLANAQVVVAPQAETAPAALSIMALDGSVNLTTDANGNLALPDLESGKYTLSITVAGVTVETILEILPANAASSGVVAAPIVVSENEQGETVASSLEGQGIFASISGVIYGPDGVLSDAQIEVSGGEATNGAVASATTNADGEFNLIINVSLDKLLAMAQAKVRIVREGYQPVILDLNVAELSGATQVTSLTGMNYPMAKQTVETEIIYSENFEQLADGAACGSWTAQAYSGGYHEGPQAFALAEEGEGDEQPAAEELLNLWHSHASGLDITNQALNIIEQDGRLELVKLAPDDSSEGKVPDPVGDNAACWYGMAESGTVGQGNFLGAIEGNGGTAENGGTSDQRNGGSIESPLIDLSNSSAPLALGFKTWWEIEAVNPNENGFDLMIVSLSTDNGTNWEDIARLNPLTDPVTGDTINREPLPYSNRGFNKAPQWLAQEPISLSEFAGEQIKLRFTFSTQDDLYNGFRGWLVDDVSIFNGEGTFPRYVAGDDFGESLVYPNFGFDNETRQVTVSGSYNGDDNLRLVLQQINPANAQTTDLVSQVLVDGEAIDLTATAAEAGAYLFLLNVYVGDSAVPAQIEPFYPGLDVGPID